MVVKVGRGGLCRFDEIFWGGNVCGISGEGVERVVRRLGNYVPDTLHFWSVSAIRDMVLRSYAFLYHQEDI